MAIYPGLRRAVFRCWGILFLSNKPIGHFLQVIKLSFIGGFYIWCYLYPISVGGFVRVLQCYFAKYRYLGAL
ncbi:protein of unknown function [Pseudomonas sp. JV241A]|nr:protein of unknown function [Pseudomonas sp. JV241A]